MNKGLELAIKVADTMSLDYKEFEKVEFCDGTNKELHDCVLINGLYIIASGKSDILIYDSHGECVGYIDGSAYKRDYEKIVILTLYLSRVF